MKHLTPRSTPMVINARNVNSALYGGLCWLAGSGELNSSRNGPVLAAPAPVITNYTSPQERVLFSALRDANPFFHLYECIWMLAGRNDAESVARYAATMGSFANERGVLAGAYGHRWRNHFGFDQLAHVINLLKEEPKTRRAVIQMYDPEVDSLQVYMSLDIPCNTAVYLDGTSGALNMTVTNRSNDIVWGAYGANAVHMSFLQEFIACAVGMPVGSYYQVSNNFHTYLNRPDVTRLIQPRAVAGSGYNVTYATDDRYAVAPTQAGAVTAYPLGGGFEGEQEFDWRKFLYECERLAEHPTESTAAFTPFLHHVFTPMMRAHREYTYGDVKGAAYALGACRATDWRTAGLEWLARREAAHKVGGAL